MHCSYYIRDKERNNNAKGNTVDSYRPDYWVVNSFSTKEGEADGAGIEIVLIYNENY
jgi:hypothetical protein